MFSHRYVTSNFEESEFCYIQNVNLRQYRRTYCGLHSNKRFMNALASSFLKSGIVYISQPVNYVINSEPASISDIRETLESCLPPTPPPSTYSLFHNFYLVTFFCIIKIHSINGQEKNSYFLLPGCRNKLRLKFVHDTIEIKVQRV
jgi:hypothetical protein